MSTAPRFSSSRKSLRSASLAVLLAVAVGVADTASAQVFNLGGPPNSRGFHQGSGRRNMVAYGNHLWAVVVEESGAVRIRQRANDVTDPWINFGPIVNSNTTGISTTNPTTNVAMACSKSGHLHITWGRYYYPGFYQQYYRCYQLWGTFTHPPQDITALVGATNLTRTDSMAIAVGQNDEVFLTAPHGTSNWRSRLLESQFTSFPTGIAPLWSNRGSISVSASSQNVRMVVDSVGRVQMSFYNNIGNGEYATRVFTSPSTWGVQENIGSPPSPRDNTGYMATDFLGFAHVLYLHVVSVTAGVTNYELRYRRRAGVAPWGAPMVVDAFTSTEVGADNPAHSYALAANTRGNRVFAIYRDYRCKRFMVKQLKPGTPGFVLLAELEPPSSLLNDYYLPNVRNTIWGGNNEMVNFLDISYRRPSGSSYRLVHQRLNIGAMDVDMAGCVGTCGVPAVTFGGVPCSPNPHAVQIGLERGRSGSPAFLLYTLTPTFAAPFAGCTLYANNLLFTAIVDPCCHAELTVPLGAGCYNLDVYFQWAVLDSGASFGWALSNRGKLTL